MSALRLLRAAAGLAGLVCTMGAGGWLAGWAVPPDPVSAKLIVVFEQEARALLKTMPPPPDAEDFLRQYVTDEVDRERWRTRRAIQYLPIVAFWAALAAHLVLRGLIQHGQWRGWFAPSARAPLATR